MSEDVQSQTVTELKENMGASEKPPGLFFVDLFLVRGRSSMTHRLCSVSLCGDTAVTVHGMNT